MSTDAKDDAKEERAAVESGGVRLGVAAWGIALALGCRAIDIFLESQSLAGAVGQAVLVEWGAARVGVGWSDPKARTTTGTIAKRALIGAAIGLSAAALLFATLAATRGVRFDRVENVELSILGIGLVTASLHAWRDELLLHGIALRALGTSVMPLARIVACGVTSAGAALGRSDATPRSVFVAALLGILFGTLWVNDRGAWKPWAAHASFRWAIGTLLSGGVVHSRLADDAWAGGTDGWLGGTAAAVALTPLAMTALLWSARSARSARRISPRSAKEG